MSVLFRFRLIPVVKAMLEEHDIDAAELVVRAELPIDALTGPITAPLARVERFLDLAADALAAPLFGFDLADRVQTGVYGVPEFLVRAAPTVQRALEAICEFAVLVNPILDFRFTASEREGVLQYAIAARRDALGCHLNEYSLAFVLRQAAAVLGGPLPVQRVWFAHGRSIQPDAVALRMGCPVVFQAAGCGFAIVRDVLERSPRTADAPLFDFLVGQAREQIAQLAPRDIISQIARTIGERLTDPELSATAVATALGTPLRTLQRHLAEAGTSYRDVLQHVRLFRRAELSRAGLGEREIAELLGFADARAMRRALDGASA